MGTRKIRVGIDVGGTHTKAVALDNDTHEIIGESVVMTTHDHEMGVAAGVIECFENCLTKNNIDPDDVVFIAHSTTQAPTPCWKATWRKLASSVWQTAALRAGCRRSSPISRILTWAQAVLSAPVIPLSS